MIESTYLFIFYNALYVLRPNSTLKTTGIGFSTVYSRIVYYFKAMHFNASLHFHMSVSYEMYLIHNISLCESWCFQDHLWCWNTACSGNRRVLLFHFLLRFYTDITFNVKVSDVYYKYGRIYCLLQNVYLVHVVSRF